MKNVIEYKKMNCTVDFRNDFCKAMIGGGRVRQCSVAERNLILAIIRQGFLDIHSKKLEIRNEAIAWLQSPYAIYYSEILGMSGETLLAGVRYHIEISQRGFRGRSEPPLKIGLKSTSAKFKKKQGNYEQDEQLALF